MARHRGNGVPAQHGVDGKCAGIRLFSAPPWGHRTVGQRLGKRPSRQDGLHAVDPMAQINIDTCPRAGMGICPSPIITVHVTHGCADSRSRAIAGVACGKGGTPADRTLDDPFHALGRLEAINLTPTPAPSVLTAEKSALALDHGWVP